MQELLDKFQGDEERVGFILPGGEVVEVVNHSAKPRESFFVSDEDVLKYGDLAIATWHTHPRGTTVLSADDYLMFSGYNKMVHYIIGTDGVQCYRDDHGFIVKVAA